MSRTGIGKSKGCRICRRRRVKCDERRPNCERCEQGGFECEGYTHDLRFVDEVARTVRHAQKAALKKPKSSSTRLVSTLPNHQHLLPEMTLVGFQDNVFVSFLLSNILSGMARSWMQRQAENTMSVTAQNSILALSKLYFGRMHRQRDLIRRGHVLYGQALKNLNNDLQDEETSWSLSVLTSSVTLQLYELIAASSSSAWLQHAGGISRLIELRGPWRHQSPAERQILEGIRATIALECVIKRKRCFLEHADWKTIPWALESTCRTPTMALHDVLMDVGGLLEDATALKTMDLSSDCFSHERHTLSTNIRVHLEELYEWRANWELRNLNNYYEIPNPSSSEYDRRLFPTVLYFSHIFTAADLTIHNAILLLLLKLGEEVGGQSFNSSIMSLLTISPKTFISTPSSDPLYLTKEAPNLETIAYEICQSAEYHLLEHHCGVGAFSLLFPLRVAHQTFKDGAPEKLWLEDLMKRGAELSGWEIGKNIWGNEAVGR